MRGAYVVHGGSSVVRAWFVHGSCVVRGWFMRGSLVVHAWFARFIGSSWLVREWFAYHRQIHM